MRRAVDTIGSAISGATDRGKSAEIVPLNVTKSSS
jgi:hypothetical protein